MLSEIQVLKAEINQLKTGSNIQFDGTVNSTVVVDCAQMENGSWVNYSHLKEGASCFTETACIKVSLNVEGVSPQALISVVPTVLYTTL